MGIKVRDNDYYMGIALLSASRTTHGKCILFVDYFDNFNICTGESEKDSLDPELFMASTTGIPECKEVFFTYTPDYKSIQMLANSYVKKIIFFQTLKINDEVISLCSTLEIEIFAYVGNLNWMRDYIFFMRSKDILSNTHK